MSSAATIIYAREDLSIPGMPDQASSASGRAAAVQTRFFKMVGDYKPDVIVLDLSLAPTTGTGTILTIRRSTDTPILVVCDPADRSSADYRAAGAAYCVPSPINIPRLHQAIQQILQEKRHPVPKSARHGEGISFAGLRFEPLRNVLIDRRGAAVGLSSSERRLLAHFLSQPPALLPRRQIGHPLYRSAAEA